MVGPGLVVAATGVGAGDMVAAGKAGASYGLVVLWAVVLGSVLKYVMAEGIARWQLATGTTVLEGWVGTLGPVVRWYFLAYLVAWTVVVGAALMAACGLAAHALVPALSVKTWGLVHTAVALAFVWFEGYGRFETAMKLVVALMFVSILGSAALQSPPLGATLRGLVVPEIPPGSTVLLMGVIGGVGGTLTLLSYNYWMEEKGWRGPAWMPGVRFDLGVGYALTGAFGIALVLLSGVVLHPRGVAIEGNGGILELAGVLGERFGRAGEIVFLAGFWGAVATSMLGVWQGVPYLFADFVGRWRASGGSTGPVSTRSRTYRGYLLFLALPPAALLFLNRPVWLVVLYAAVGSLFMPFLAGTLLVMNNRRKTLGALRNGVFANAMLGLCLALFLYLAVNEIRDRF